MNGSLNIVSLVTGVRHRQSCRSDIRYGLVLTVFLLILVIFPIGSQQANCEQIPSATNSHSTVPMLTGKKFHQALEQSCSGIWSNLSFRQLLMEIGTSRQIAIVLDRRIDPSAERHFKMEESSLRQGLAGIAKQAGVDVSFPENLVYLGPKSATRNLRTLIELRRLELQSKDSKIPKPRRTELLRTHTFESKDLDAPRELLEQFASRSHLRISNPQLIPHDLWGAMTLPDVSVIEALSVVLIQFDLSFRWDKEGNEIELIPVPSVVQLERTYPAKKKPDEILSSIRQHFPNLAAEVSKNEIVARGSLEDHEEIAALLRGDRRKSPIKVEAPVPLSRQIFSLKAQQLPVISLMKKLEESAITFSYDPDELKTAGIDLETRINIDVKDVSTDELFQRIFDPVGIQFQIVESTVKLKPKKK